MASVDERLREIALKHGLLQQNDSRRVVWLVMPALRAVYDAGLERAAEIVESYPLTRTECEAMNPMEGVADAIRQEKEQAR